MADFYSSGPMSCFEWLQGPSQEQQQVSSSTADQKQEQSVATETTAEAAPAVACGTLTKANVELQCLGIRRPSFNSGSEASTVDSLTTGPILAVAESTDKIPSISTFAAAFDERKQRWNARKEERQLRKSREQAQHRSNFTSKFTSEQGVVHNSFNRNEHESIVNVNQAREALELYRFNCVGSEVWSSRFASNPGLPDAPMDSELTN
jgi:hypothetical protein